MSRKLSALEQKIHQTALAATDRTLTAKEVEALSTDVSARTEALNFLLRANLLKPAKDAGGRTVFRAVSRKEFEVKKDLSGEENLVLSHIQASGTEGIWTKHIKVKTELHQTIIDRCLKSLTQKQLIKPVKGTVQHPTRKIYMLYHLEPSVEVTGGPWYTDKELDTEFIKLLMAACLKFVRDRSFPRTKSSTANPNSRVLYPISASPNYPTAAQIQTFLNKSRITETQLTVEHVEMLMNVLVIDGEVEKIPALGAALWDPAVDEDSDGGSEDTSDDEESELERSRGKKRKRSENGGSTRKKKRKKSAVESSESEDAESDSDADDRASTRRKEKERAKSKGKEKRKGKKRKKSESSGNESGNESEDVRRRKSKKTKIEERASSTEDGSDDEAEKTKRLRSKKSKRKTVSPADTSGSESSSEESSGEPPRKSKTKSRSSSAKTKAKSKLSFESTLDDNTGEFGGMHVYRAIYPERFPPASFGYSQAPCGRCPTFDFCKPGGPVNPHECVYYTDWLGQAPVKIE